MFFLYRHCDIKSKDSSALFSLSAQADCSYYHVRAGFILFFFSQMKKLNVDKLSMNFYTAQHNHISNTPKEEAFMLFVSVSKAL